MKALEKWNKLARELDLAAFRVVGAAKVLAPQELNEELKAYEDAKAALQAYQQSDEYRAVGVA